MNKIPSKAMIASESKEVHPHPIEEAVIRSIVAYAGVVIIGYIFFQSGIFRPTFFYFQIAFVGLMCSLFYVALDLLKTKTAVGFYLILIFAFEFIMPKSLNLVPYLRDLLFPGVAGAAIFLFMKYKPAGTDNTIARPLVLAFYLALGAVITTTLLTFATGLWSDYGFWLYRNCYMHCLTGLGLGIGIEAGERVYRFYFEQNHSEEL